MAIPTYTEEEISMIREGGTILRACLDHVALLVKPGVTTKDLDTEAETFIRDRGGDPAFKGYQGFPATLCTSINEQCVHGIPGDHALTEGDIISIDCGVILHGFYTDACITVPVGKISNEASKLMHVTEGALKKSLSILKAGVSVGDISSAIQKYVEERGFQPVKSLTGHGVGKNLHDVPDIPNFGKAGTGPVFPVNTIVAIEPIIVAGDPAVIQESDNWTITTRDKSLCAHYEHTIVVRESGAEILA